MYTRKDIDCIYYAGDSGREGIYIQALIRNQIFRTAPKFQEKVVWIDSFTEQAILDGIRKAKPYADYQHMIDSGYAWAISDWLIGMNFTQAFTLSAGKLIKVGRVMTPTLAMIVKRQDEIDHFVKTPYFGVKADGFAVWKAVRESRFANSLLLYSDTGFRKKEDAENLVRECSQDMHLTVENVNVQKKTEYAPYLFNLADLQAYCSRQFKISPSKTLEYAQSLYEKKFTTYPRTDSRFLSTAVAQDLQKKGYVIPKRYVDDSKVTDHYAIIPTLHGDKNTLSGTEKQVYEAIEKRFMDTMKPPFVYDAVSVTYLHRNGERFFENFRIVREKGFKEKIDGDDIVTKPIPEKGSTVAVDSFSVYDMETKPPSVYTTGSLILAMEKAGKLIEDEELREQIKTSGIGTSATRAGIIEKLSTPDKNGISFITIDSKTQKVAPTEFGKKAIPVIAKYDEALISPVKTADMESRLNAIACGELAKDSYFHEVKEYVAGTTKKILAEKQESLASFGSSRSGTEYSCPCCGKSLKHGRYGWFCEDRQDCGFSFSAVICGHEMKESDLADILSKGSTRTYTFKSKAGKSFKAKVTLNKAERKTELAFVNSNSSKPSGKSTSSQKKKSSTSGWGKSNSSGWGQKK